MEKRFVATLYEAIKIFNQSHKNTSQIISAINRYLLPSFGLKLSGSRISKKELEKANSIAQTIELSQFNRINLIDRTEKIFRQHNLPNSKCKFLRSRINYFISFLEKNQLICSGKEIIKSEKAFKFKSKVIDKKGIKIIKQRKSKPKIQLCFDRKFYLNKDKKTNIKIVDKELKRIECELNDLRKYVEKKRENREVTADYKVEQIARLLGWIYIKEKDLTRVSLSYLIEVIDTKINVFDFKEVNDYFLEKGKLEYKAQESAKFTIQWIKDFFVEYEVDNPRTKGGYIESLILMAKYLYKDITNQEAAKDCEDILAIKYLKVYRTQLPKKSKEIKNLYLDWNEVLIVRNRLKVEADLDCSFFSHTRKGKKRIDKERRNKTAIATSIMKFLMLCFLTIIPPDRIRTIRELKIGKTLKHGLKTNSGFIDFKDLTNNKTAKYYIHLCSEDYKTGDIYGEFWGELSNIHFEDGSTFYEYLNKWLYSGWRKEILNIHNLSHDYVFLGVRNSKPLTKSTSSSYIKNIFIGKTGLPVNPHRLRHIFCTYIDQFDISPKEQESIAFWMHHSQDIAKKVYTVKKLEQKLLPGFNLMKKIQEMGVE